MIAQEAPTCDPPKDGLFVNLVHYGWNLAYQHAVAAFRIREYRECAVLFHQLLRSTAYPIDTPGALPDSIRRSIISTLAIKRVRRADPTSIPSVRPRLSKTRVAKQAAHKIHTRRNNSMITRHGGSDDDNKDNKYTDADNEEDNYSSDGNNSNKHTDTIATVQKKQTTKRDEEDTRNDIDETTESDSESESNNDDDDNDDDDDDAYGADTYNAEDKEEPERKAKENNEFEEEEEKEEEDDSDNFEAPVLFKPNVFRFSVPVRIVSVTPETEKNDSVEAPRVSKSKNTQPVTSDVLRISTIKKLVYLLSSRSRAESSVVQSRNTEVEKCTQTLITSVFSC